MLCYLDQIQHASTKLSFRITNSLILLLVLHSAYKLQIMFLFCCSTENPYPNREVVTIKLNDRVQEETEGKKVLIETVFEMNYKTGMWRKLQYKRPHQ